MLAFSPKVLAFPPEVLAFLPKVLAFLTKVLAFSELPVQVLVHRYHVSGRTVGKVLNLRLRVVSYLGWFRRPRFCRGRGLEVLVTLDLWTLS